MANMNVPDEWYQWGDNGWEVDPGWWENNHDIDIPASIQANLDLGPLYQTQPQSPDSRGGPALIPAIMAGAGTTLGLNAAFNIDQNSVPMEGPMRFAGRGIPKYSNDGIHKDAPDVMIPMPMPRFPTLPGRDPISIWETSPDGGPRRGSRKPPYRIPMAPDKGPDLRTKWEVWKDSFRDDWRAK